MISLDKLKSAAKQNAWYDDPNDENQNFLNLGVQNPFKKYRSPTISRQTTLNSGDLEAGTGLGKAQSNPEHPIQHEGTNHIAGGVKHADTTPNVQSSNKDYPQGDVGDIPRSESPTGEKIHPIPEEYERPEKHSGDTSETVGNGYESPEKDSLKKRNPTGEKKKRSLLDLVKGKATDRQDTMDSTGKSKPKFTVGNQIRNTLFSSWVNVLLIMSPVGIAVHFAKIDPVAIFVINFIAIIPLAGMLSYATEEIALRTGEVIGGLLNASFGNAVELIVSIVALVQDQVLIVQTSLIGSMLSNLLLVMGMCFFFGGINRVEQNFNMTVAQTAASLLFLAVGALLIPTCFDEFANIGTQSQRANPDPGNPKPHVADLSRAVSILLLIVYGCYLFFQLKSHNAMFSEPSQKTAKRDVKGKIRAALPDRFQSKSPEPGNELAPDGEEEPEEPNLSIWVAMGTLAASTVLVALNAEFLVDAINEVTCGGGISKNFVGLILLPIVGNAAEHATAVTVAVKDKMDLAIGVAVGSSMQIALLVLPLVVVLGWIIGKDDMTLFFDGFQIVVLFVAVLLVNYLIQDGKSHWLEGVMLMILYIIIAVAAWYYPTSPKLSDCPT